MRTLALLPFLLYLTWSQDPSSTISDDLSPSQNGSPWSCCPTKLVSNIPPPNEELNGVYTLKEIGNKSEEICYDGCIYAKGEDEFCFIVKAIKDSADIICEVWCTCFLSSI